MRSHAPPQADLIGTCTFLETHLLKQLRTAAVRDETVFLQPPGAQDVAGVSPRRVYESLPLGV